MRISIFLLFLCIPVIIHSQDIQGKPKHELTPALSFSLNSNGFASIPSFSLDKPALIASVNLVRGRFSYDPTLAYSLELKPWFIDNWFHYKIIEGSKFDLKAGINISTFCSGLFINDNEFLRAERYFAFSLAGTYKFTPASSLTLDYWNDNGQEAGSLSGHFISMVYDMSGIRLAEKTFLGIRLMLFYITYEGDNDGLFVSPTITISKLNFPLSLFFQANQPVQTNISPNPGFKWNVGISYSL